MGRRKKRLRTLTVTLGLVALSGCMTPDASKSQVQVQKPDVTQPGVLPPPQDVMAGTTLTGATSSTGGVVPASGTQPAQATTVTQSAAPSAAARAGQKLAKLTRLDKKFPATEMEVAWRNYTQQLPDPARNGAMGSGLAGQMFLFGGPKLQFVEAEGVLTVDLIDVTPRPPGQKAATPERWQFNKEMLRNLKATDETFGRSYVLFLPWPDYRPDITRVRISARYDPENGPTLYAMPSIVSLNPNGPVWDGTLTNVPMGERDQPVSRMGSNPAQFSGSLPMGAMPPGMLPGGMIPGGTMPGAPQPLGAGLPPQFSLPPQMQMPQPQMMPPIPLSPSGPVGPPPAAMPLSPGVAPGTIPLAPVPTEELAPIGFTLNR